MQPQDLSLHSHPSENFPSDTTPVRSASNPQMEALKEKVRQLKHKLHLEHESFTRNPDKMTWDEMMEKYEKWKADYDIWDKERKVAYADSYDKGASEPYEGNLCEFLSPGHVNSYVITINILAAQSYLEKHLKNANYHIYIHGEETFLNIKIGDELCRYWIHKDTDKTEENLVPNDVLENLLKSSFGNIAAQLSTGAVRVTLKIDQKLDYNIVCFRQYTIDQLTDLLKKGQLDRVEKYFEYLFGSPNPEYMTSDFLVKLLAKSRWRFSQEEIHTIHNKIEELV